MSDLHELYQEMILDHNRHPHNFRVMPESDHRAEGYNPLCGDRVTLFVKLESGRIADASFQGSGCAISIASASVLTETVKGKTLAEAANLFERFYGLVTGKNLENGKNLGKLAVFSGVSGFPARVKCATLAWHTLQSALGKGEAVTTEKDDAAPGEIR
ncbi:MAG: SUF system NifU family Fe-S cluster assembly protein [Acidobacteria bacterium]|nr:MAG: SUF system NifU family Fe-S cluster assembly protein [Acidobacteriota bacterium]